MKLKTWENYDEYNHLNNVNSLHYRMEERHGRCHGVADKYLPRYCALWAKVYSLSGVCIQDKISDILGLYRFRDYEKRTKNSELKTLNIFKKAAS